MINVFKKSENVNDYNPTKPVSLRPDFNSTKIKKLEVTCFINYPSYIHTTIWKSIYSCFCNLIVLPTSVCLPPR